MDHNRRRSCVGERLGGGWAAVATHLGDAECDDLIILSAVEEDDYKEAMTAAGVKPLA